ncbi:MAG: hypothetical protein RML74_00465 [Acidobacteriota bacterium]|nr:hypothetical protein [Acidobacteriota bacterium]
MRHEERSRLSRRDGNLAWLGHSLFESGIPVARLLRSDDGRAAETIEIGIIRFLIPRSFPFIRKGASVLA